MFCIYLIICLIVAFSLRLIYLYDTDNDSSKTLIFHGGYEEIYPVIVILGVCLWFIFVPYYLVIFLADIFYKYIIK